MNKCPSDINERLQTTNPDQWASVKQYSCYLRWLFWNTSLWCSFWRIRGSVLPLRWLGTVSWFGGEWYIRSRILRRGGGSIGLWVVIATTHRLEFRVPTCQRVIVVFLLGVRVKGVVWIFLKLSILRSGGVLRAKAI